MSDDFKLPAHLQKQVDDQLGGSSLERAFDTALLQTGKDLPTPVPEYEFHPIRKWRFDRAWPQFYVAVELHGGTEGFPVICHNCGSRVRAKKADGSPGKEIRTPGYHAHRSNFKSDMEKFNIAISLGWKVLQFDRENVINDPFEMVSLIRAVLDDRRYMGLEMKDLSDRELEILHFIAGGFKTNEIAERLECSSNTVTSHVDGIMRKMNARSRTQAAVLAHAVGWIDPARIPWAEELSLEEFIEQMLKNAEKQI